MIRQLIALTGNVAMFGSATFATITHDDYRLWFVAIAGFIITLITRIPAIKKSRYEAMQARLNLCDDCLKSENKPISCVVAKKHRPKNCPIQD